MHPQVIFINDSGGNSTLRKINSANKTDKSVCVSMPIGSVQLHHSVFRERRDLISHYLLSLEQESLFQNHLLEAGFRIDTPCDQLHRGWEEPHCQLRGHFAGHWLSAAAFNCSVERSPVLEGIIEEAVELLLECQKANGGEWAASIPEKYFGFLESGRGVWSPQYTAHKTLMGLVDVYRFMGNEKALNILESWSKWYLNWCRRLNSENKAAIIYQGECAGMLELWADLFILTEKEHYLELCYYYGSPSLFTRLLEGEDALSHTHANASIPWIQGAARVYEATGDKYYRDVVEKFWDVAVTKRGMFATTGCNAGEYWIPPGKLDQFFGERTQEHCTVYNMIRVADFLFRWTGEVTYTQYIEKALYNGILAQQNKTTGMVCYFLPISPGSRKVWGRETDDFWCCHGTLVQAHSSYENLIYHRRGDGLSIDQYIPSEIKLEKGVRVRQKRQWTPNDINSTFAVEIEVDSTSPNPWTLSLRIPDWIETKPKVSINGEQVDSFTVENGYIKLKRIWRDSLVYLSFTKHIRKEYLPGSTTLFAFLDGPVVLAAISNQEVNPDRDARVRPCQEHQYVGGKEWLESNYILETSEGNVKLVPLYEIQDESYSIYHRDMTN